MRHKCKRCSVFRWTHAAPSMVKHTISPCMKQFVLCDQVDPLCGGSQPPCATGVARVDRQRHCLSKISGPQDAQLQVPTLCMHGLAQLSVYKLAMVLYAHILQEFLYMYAKFSVWLKGPDCCHTYLAPAGKHVKYYSGIIILYAARMQLSVYRFSTCWRSGIGMEYALQIPSIAIGWHTWKLLL